MASATSTSPLHRAASLAGFALTRRFAVAHLGQLPVLLVAITAVVAIAAAYWLSLLLHPYTSCRRCDGHGRARGGIFTRSYALCASCDGTGHVPRLGTRLLSAANRPPRPRGPIQ